MVKRTMSAIPSVLEDWETVVNGNFDVLGDDGLPMSVPEQSTPASLPTATSHDTSIIFVNHAKLGWALFEDDKADYFALCPIETLNMSGGEAGALTTVKLNIDDLGFGDAAALAGIDRAVRHPTRIFAYAVNVHHANGSDPGDWTLHVQNVTSATTRTVTTIALNAASATDEITTGDLGAVLDIADGEVWRAWLTGPSTTNPIFGVTLYARIHVPSD